MYVYTVKPNWNGQCDNVPEKKIDIPMCLSLKGTFHDPMTVRFRCMISI